MSKTVIRTKITRIVEVGILEVREKSFCENRHAKTLPLPRLASSALGGSCHSTLPQVPSEQTSVGGS